jgi:hypothetical protein
MYEQNRYLRGNKYCQLCLLSNQLVAMEDKLYTKVSCFRSAYVCYDLDLGSPKELHIVKE